jgi:hypothetical protein
MPDLQPTDEKNASLTKMLASTLKDSKWLVREWEHLKEEYGDMFVAVLDCKVIAHHKDIESLMKIVDEKVPDRKDFVTTEFINMREVRWIR